MRPQGLSFWESHLMRRPFHYGHRLWDYSTAKGGFC